MDKEVNELLRHIEYGQLETFAAQYASEHISFKKHLLEYFNPQKPGKSLNEYRQIAAGTFDFELPSRYSRGYDFYAAASEAENELSGLLEKAKYFITKNNFKEAAAIAQSIIESIPRHYEMVDDSNGGLGGVFNDAVALLLTIVENGQADKELKTEIFHWLGREVKERIYEDYGFDEIHSLLIPCTQAAGLFNDALDIAEERIRLTAGNEYRLERAVKDKIRLLQQNSMDNEAALTTNEYIELAGIRKMKAAALLEQSRYPEAIMLIKEGIRVAEKKGLPGLVTDWKDQLLDIYIMLNDHIHIVRYAEELFYHGRDPMKYYHILKKETDKEKWVICSDELISKRKPQSSLGYPDHVLAQVYIEEKYWDRLLHLVKESELSGLQAYEQYLKPHFPEELSNLFAEKVKMYAERNMGRHHYQQVAEILKKIRTYPGGNEVVDKLLTEFKMKYKARRAMMEELRGV